MLVAVLLLTAGRVHAQSVTLAWDANFEPDLAGYIIGYGTAPGQNQQMVDVGFATQWTLAGFTGGHTYYFRVYAYSTTGARSRPSAEVSSTIGGTSGSGGTGGCIGPAPVAGWICLNGGWVPPDSPLLGGGTSAPAPPPVTSTGCPWSAPGAGWVCQAGNWLPPDHPLLWNSPAQPSCPGSAPGVMWVCVDGNWIPPTSPAPSSPPPPAPPTGTTPCPGSSPGLGWVCQAGNWLPPGHPLRLGPAPAPANPTACPGSSPGLGWLCISGNWIPPDHPLAKRGGGETP